MSSAKQIASYFIVKASQMGDGNKEFSGNNDLTNLKLQKLLYFAQVEYLKKYGTPLFDDEIQAWQYGPVVKSVYDWLKCYGSYVITDFDVELEDFNNLPENIKDFLEAIWKKYVKYSAWGLVEKTHEKGSPWDIVYADGSGNKKTISLKLLSSADTLNEIY